MCLSRQGSGLKIDCDLMQELLLFWWQQTSSFSSSLCLARALYWILIAIWWHLICLFLPRTTTSYMWQRGERQTCDLFCSFFENLTSATLIDWRLVLRKTGLSSSRMTDLSSFLSLREQKCNECCFQPSHEYFSKYVFSWISWICHSWSKVSTFAWLDMNWQSLLGNLLQPFHSEENLKSDIATESNSRYASGASWPWKEVKWQLLTKRINLHRTSDWLAQGNWLQMAMMSTVRCNADILQVGMRLVAPPTHMMSRSILA